MGNGQARKETMKIMKTSIALAAFMIGGKFWARFGLRNMGIAPAGVEKKFTGHHHLIIDAELPPFDEEIPADRNYLHYGKGYSEGRVKLPPGKFLFDSCRSDAPQCKSAMFQQAPDTPPRRTTQV